MTRSAGVRAGERRKRPHGERTRQKLIETAIDLLRREGLSALTTVRLTEAAGITQPAFYRHFRDVGECQRAALRVITERLRGVVVMLRDELSNTDSEDLDGVTAHYERLLTLLEAEKAFLAVYFRIRNDPSPLGNVARRFYRELRQDLETYLCGLARRFGIEAAQLPLVEHHARVVLDAVLGTLEDLVEGDLPPARRSGAARVLALSNYFGVLAVFRECVARQSGTPYGRVKLRPLSGS